jgi:hypothetical protein
MKKSYFDLTTVKDHYTPEIVAQWFKNKQSESQEPSNTDLYSEGKPSNMSLHGFNPEIVALLKASRHEEEMNINQAIQASLLGIQKDQEDRDLALAIQASQLESKNPQKFGESSKARKIPLDDIQIEVIAERRIDDRDGFIPQILKISHIRSRLFESGRFTSHSYDNELVSLERKLPINSSIRRSARRSDIIDRTLNNIIISREILNSPSYIESRNINTSELHSELLKVEKAFEEVLQECKRESTYLERAYNTPGHNIPNALDRLLADTRNRDMQDSRYSKLTLERSLHTLDNTNSLLDSRLDTLEQIEKNVYSDEGKGKDRAN